MLAIRLLPLSKRSPHLISLGLLEVAIAIPHPGRKESHIPSHFDGGH
jgi:hypothetical protein